jgi:Amt family ammonium transporter
VISLLAVTRKYKLGYDDSLDVVGVHGIGGILGMLAIGLIGSKVANSAGGDGLFINGSISLLEKQAVAVIATALFSFCATWLIAKVISSTIGFRAYRDDELTGLDTTYHAETAYDLGNSNRY